MSDFRTKLHETLLLFKDGIDMLSIADQIEQSHNEDVQKSARSAYLRGVEEGALAPVILVIIAGLALIVWACVGIRGYNEDNDRQAKINAEKMEKDKPRVAEIMSSCSAGDYAKCRSGWTEFNTDLYTNSGLQTRVNNICASFEEAYYNRTGKLLVNNSNYSFFKAVEKQ